MGTTKELKSIQQLFKQHRNRPPHPAFEFINPRFAHAGAMLHRAEIRGSDFSVGSKRRFHMHIRCSAKCLYAPNRNRLNEHHLFFHADDDGSGVSLRPHRASLNAAWTVHLIGSGSDPHDDAAGGERLHHLLLHSAAYGRYLAATDTPAASVLGGHHQVAQRDFDRLDDESVLWHASRLGSGDAVLLRHATGRYLHDSDGTTVTIASSDAKKTRWIVETMTIGSRDCMPTFPNPSQAQQELFIRNIRFIRAIPHGVFSDNWNTFQFSGRSVNGLKNELARRAAVDLVMKYSMCIRAGCHGRLTPLVIDLLPRSTDNLDVILLMTEETKSCSQDKEAGKEAAKESLSEHLVTDPQLALSNYQRAQNEVVCRERKNRINRAQYEDKRRNIRWNDLTSEQKKRTVKELKEDSDELSKQENHIREWKEKEADAKETYDRSLLRHQQE
uniref:DUF569 domain-containing protein n=1 Tax=Leersia perrieri TaxID=77586 RepID=A0A0D9WM74_9ORYZ